MLNIIGGKTQPQISLPLDIAEVEVIRANLNEAGDYIISIESTKPFIICQYCERKLTKFHGHGRAANRVTTLINFRVSNLYPLSPVTGQNNW